MACPSPRNRSGPYPAGCPIASSRDVPQQIELADVDEHGCGRPEGPRAPPRPRVPARGERDAGFIGDGGTIDVPRGESKAGWCRADRASARISFLSTTLRRERDVKSRGVAHAMSRSSRSIRAVASPVGRLMIRRPCAILHVSKPCRSWPDRKDRSGTADPDRCGLSLCSGLGEHREASRIELVVDRGARPARHPARSRSDEQLVDAGADRASRGSRKGSDRIHRPAKRTSAFREAHQAERRSSRTSSRRGQLPHLTAPTDHRTLSG